MPIEQPEILPSAPPQAAATTLDPAAPLSASAHRPDIGQLFRFAISIWLVMIPVRGHVMGYGWYFLSSPLTCAWPVLAGAYLDLLYLLTLTATFLLLLKAAPGKFLRRLLYILFFASGILSLLFGLANIQVVGMVGHPLTYSWLYYSGFLRSYDALQALAAGFTPSIAIAGVLCLLAPFALSSSLRRAGRLLPHFGLTPQKALLAGLALLLLYIPASIHATRTTYRPSIQNPVVFLASSLLEKSDHRLFTVATSASTADYHPASPSAKPAPASPAIRNVLIVVLESVAAQYLPAFGGDQPITPELDAFLPQSRLYTSIYAHAPATNKSLVSLLCSLYPWPTYRFLTQEHPDANLASISELLHQQGYRTAFISAADLRFGDAETFLSHHKFDSVLDHRSLQTADRFKSDEGNHLDGVSDSAVCQKLSDWITQDPARPFFAVLWTNQTHYPYFLRDDAGDNNPPATSLSDQLLGRYYRAIRQIDAAVGQLLRDLNRQGLADSTLVVIVGDHGEAFGQHGRFGHGNALKEFKGATGGFGHGTALYEENIHVPLILINPKLFSGEKDHTLGGLVDVAPTVFDLLRQPQPSGWQGRSLLRNPQRQRIYFAAPWSGAVFGYRQGDRKFLFDAIANTYKIFDLRNDPYERIDLSHQYTPAQLDEIHQQIAAWVQYQDRLIRNVTAPATPSPKPQVALHPQEAQ